MEGLREDTEGYNIVRDLFQDVARRRGMLIQGESNSNEGEAIFGEALSRSKVVSLIKSYRREAYISMALSLRDEELSDVLGRIRSCRGFEDFGRNELLLRRAFYAVRGESLVSMAKKEGVKLQAIAPYLESHGLYNIWREERNRLKLPVKKRYNFTSE